ncbi:MAG: InlB B-repeat-containing protein, partial [Ignavibacteria bacterium]|nr:InlB B-repeat-containing protein [Ignavibacteria bacterium]
DTVTISGDTYLVTTTSKAISSAAFTSTLGTRAYTFTIVSVSRQSGATDTSTISIVASSGVVTASASAPADTYTVVVRVTDARGDTEQATLTIRVNETITISGVTTLTTTYSIETSTTYSATGGTTASTGGSGSLVLTMRSVARTTSPSGDTSTITFNPSTGVVSIPGSTPHDTYTIIIRATDSVGAYVEKTLVLRVNETVAVSGDTRLISTEGRTWTSSQFVASLGTGPYTYQIVRTSDGSAVAGITISAAGVVSVANTIAVNNASDTYPMTVIITDAVGDSITTQLEVVINDTVTISGDTYLVTTITKAISSRPFTSTLGTLPYTFSIVSVVGSDTSSISGMSITQVGDGSSMSVASSYSVTYNSNSSQHQPGFVSGSVPSTTSYASGAVVTVASNSGGLARQGFTFAGWNTAADGSGTTYEAGSASFTMPAGNMTLYAKWEIPAAARLIGSTGAVYDFSNPNNVSNGSICISGNVRGITSDGTYVYYRKNTSPSYLCKSTLAGVVVQAYNAGISAPSEQNDLTYSRGCVFVRKTLGGTTQIECIDVSDGSVTTKNLPAGYGLSGTFWLYGNLIDFPDGRIGSVSASNQSLPEGTGAGQCPSGFNCKVLTLFTVSGTGKNSSLAFSETMVLADSESGWPSDDHGIATDGTYLYQTHHAQGYKVWALRSGAPSYLVFNGSGSGSCGASTGVSQTMCYIFQPTGSGTTLMSNATFFGRSHATNQYIMGDYEGNKFYLSGSAVPPAGPGSLVLDTITIDSSTGVVTANDRTPAGIYTVVVQVADARGDTEQATLTIRVNDTITISGATSLTTTYSIDTTTTYSAAGGTTAASGGSGSLVLTMESVRRTTNTGGDTSTVTFNPSTGLLSISATTPHDTYTIVIRATDSVGAYVEKTLTLRVNESVAVSGASSITTTEGRETTVAFTASQGTSGYTYQIVRTDNGATVPGITISSSGVVTIKDTLAVNSAVDTYTMTVIVTDSRGDSVTASLTITINDTVQISGDTYLVTTVSKAISSSPFSTTYGTAGFTYSI